MRSIQPTPCLAVFDNRGFEVPGGQASVASLKCNDLPRTLITVIPQLISSSTEVPARHAPAGAVAGALVASERGPEGDAVDMGRFGDAVVQEGGGVPSHQAVKEGGSRSRCVNGLLQGGVGTQHCWLSMSGVMLRWPTLGFALAFTFTLDNLVASVCAACKLNETQC